MVKFNGIFIQIVFFLLTILILTSFYLRYVKTRLILVDILTIVSTALFLSGVINIVIGYGEANRQKKIEKNNYL